ncbi:MAG: hypothetical protein IJE75_00105, partial [Firmicutes bacterium]|nr:hypothetical protein [Bacillota bacterium]
EGAAPERVKALCDPTFFRHIHPPFMLENQALFCHYTKPKWNVKRIKKIIDTGQKNVEISKVNIYYRIVFL